MVQRIWQCSTVSTHREAGERHRGCGAAVELHESINDNGVMKMEPHPEGFEIPAGGTLELKPGGKHVMLLGLVKPLAVGDTIELTLNFEGQRPDNGERAGTGHPGLHAGDKVRWARWGMPVARRRPP